MLGDLGCEFERCPLSFVGVVLGFQRGVPYGLESEWLYPEEPEPSDDPWA
jgi:hypothetical protein